MQTDFPLESGVHPFTGLANVLLERAAESHRFLDSTPPAFQVYRRLSDLTESPRRMQ